MDHLLTRQQVRRVDTIAIEELGIPGAVLMENAGRGAADAIRTLVHDRQAKRVVVFCGSGNNGGDGFVIARHLLNSGLSVAVYLTAPESGLRGDAALNHRILANMGHEILPCDTAEAMRRAAQNLTADDVVVDALLGTGFSGELRQPLADLVQALNESPATARIAIDIPSGLDCDRGVPGGAAIRADLTVTFVARKAGFAQPDSRQWTGEVIVADIGTPPDLINHVLKDGA
ncbi:MAG: NAD(P)H-hydrate epimerase [bacterium]|nr:NAD(P)H-hydrate epimerase [bacterium]